MLSFNDQIDNPTFLAVEGSGIKGDQILNVDVNKMVSSLDIKPEKKNILKHEFNKFKNISNSKNLEKKLEDWDNNDLVGFLKDNKTLSDEQLNLVKRQKLDGMDLLTHQSEDLLAILNNDKQLLNEVKGVKALSQLDTKESSIGDLGLVIAELKMQNSKLKSDLTSAQNRVDSLKTQIQTNEHESDTLKSN